MKRLNSANGSKHSGEGPSREALASWRAFEEQLLDLQEFYRQARVAAWEREMAQVERLWKQMGNQWEEHWEAMTAQAEQSLEQISNAAAAAGGQMSQSLSGTIQAMATEFDLLGAKVSSTLELAAQGRQSGSSGSWSEAGSWFGAGLLEVFDWFHQGGVVRAHQGMAIAPDTAAGLGGLAADERLIVAQTGEGILPRDSMARLGRENFEALRTGEFAQVGLPAQAAVPTYNLTIQVQALDGESVAGLQWERLVRQRILPALERQGRRL